MRTPSTLVLSFALIAAALTAACLRPAPVREAPRVVTLAPPTVQATAPADFAGLHNVVAYHDGLYSGSQPEGVEGLETLHAMGIRTIISVDGAKPDAEKARQLGMRYVHLPIGYDGIDETRTLEIARAVRDLPGPTYIHCHHGKHRSAGAAGAAAVTLGYSDRAAALARMKVSGTAANYKGLFECVEVATADDAAARLARASNAFPEIAKTSGLVDLMVEIDEIFDHLKAIEKAGWKAPADHPDLVPAAEAGRLETALRTLADDPDVQTKPGEFREWLVKSAADSQKLEESMVAGATTEELSATFKAIGQDCKQCHAKYRD